MDCLLLALHELERSGYTDFNGIPNTLDKVKILAKQYSKTIEGGAITDTEISSLCYMITSGYSMFESAQTLHTHERKEHT